MYSSRIAALRRRGNQSLDTDIGTMSVTRDFRGKGCEDGKERQQLVAYKICNTELHSSQHNTCYDLKINWYG